ncbi:MAG: copper chaperone PCu(A)C [Dichotomicrobium sp.]
MKYFMPILAMLALCLISTMAAHAHVETVSDLEIVHPWAKASLKGVPNSAAYMAITNTGDTDDRLVAVSAEVSENTELHTMSMEEGVMRMRRIEGGLILPAGETVVLEPGGKHIMLIGLRRQLKPGDRFDLSFTFENAGEHTIEVRVPEAQEDGGT